MKNTSLPPKDGELGRACKPTRGTGGQIHAEDSVQFSRFAPLLCRRSWLRCFDVGLAHAPPGLPSFPCGFLPYAVLERAAGNQLSAELSTSPDAPPSLPRLRDALDAAAAMAAVFQPMLAAGPGDREVHFYRDMNPNNLFILARPSEVRWTIIDYAGGTMCCQPGAGADECAGDVPVCTAMLLAKGWSRRARAVQKQGTHAPTFIDSP